MTGLAFIIVGVAILIAGMIALVIGLVRAPEGAEDEAGYHPAQHTGGVARSRYYSAKSVPPRPSPGAKRFKRHSPAA